MMNRYFIYTIVLFCLIFKSNAQEIKFTESFTWLDNDSQEGFRIAESIDLDEQTGLPVKVVKIPLVSYFDVDDVQINYGLNDYTIVASDDLSGLTEDVSSLKLFRKHVVCVRRKYFLEMEIIPIFFNEEKKQIVKANEIEFTIALPEITPKTVLKSQKVTVSNSILATGKWVKIKVTESGVHKIPYSKLTSWGFSNPSNVNVFGNGGNMLPRANAEFRHQDLTENAVIHDDNTIYFYAQGPTEWNYDSYRKMFLHQLHDYTNEAYYFLSEEHGVGLRVQDSDQTSEMYTNETSEYDSYKFHEIDKQNILKSGIEWYGESFDPGQTQSFSFDFDNRVPGSEIMVYANVIARSDPSSSFTLSNNGSVLKKTSIYRVEYNKQEGAFANEGKMFTSLNNGGDQLSLDLTYNSTSSGATGWLNFICINSKESIDFEDQLMFRNMDVTGSGQSTRFNIDGVTNTSILWDVTEHTQPKNISIESNGFTYKTDELKEFVVFDAQGKLPEPEYDGGIDNQNIRAIGVPEMLIIAHPLFDEEAKRLAAIHLEHSGLQCEIVYPYQIFNEFSSGSPDISAIRDFARYLYKRDERFKYLLLFGDGSFDNRTYSEDNTNFILTYQSDNSINYASSFVSDDFYGFLDDNEGVNIMYDKLDIGIGRFPVSTASEAKAMVDKIDKYINESSVGPWKTEITFLADDGDGNLHMRQADELSGQVYTSYSAFNHNKIYFDAYPKVTASSGDRYPEVNLAIEQTIEEGTLIFNYTGHGGEHYLGHERVLDIDAIKRFTNLDRLPVFVTATCEFSRYDDYHHTSAGEWVVLSPLGGGISMFTTTRIAWSNENLQINKSFYRNIFEEDENGDKVRLGEVIRNSKNEISSSANKLNFTLLGDPALRLAYPTGNIKTKSINGNDDESKQDTIKAISLAEIEGQIESESTGRSTVTIQVYDKPVKAKTLGNKGATPFEYEVYQNRIYKGVLDANDDHFLTSFLVPKDIRYNVGEGRISYYSYDENGVESFGADNTVLVGGVADNPPSDNTGPQIDLMLNDDSFVSGSVTGMQPILLADLEDESGINISGVGIGHDMTLVIDNNRSLPINLNSFYQAENNSYTKGKINYQLPKLAEGKHTLELKVWDNMNNSSVKTIEFEVKLDGSLKISNSTVGPNPATQGETITFGFSHDAPNQVLDISYTIYNTAGRLIEKHQLTQASKGNRIEDIEWMPSSALSKGIYIVRFEIRSEEKQFGTFSEKILIVR